MPLFILMAVLVAGCACLIPFININTDMTRYLPDASPMKIGMDVVAQDSSELDAQMRSMGASFGNAENLMPNELPKALTVGVSLALLVLLLMCPSLADVLLIMVSIGFAVILNMGTNALLPDVSLMTTTLCPVLQMILSMDYSIILVNRYRQEKALGRGAAEALQAAISGASSSILSSAFTTVVSLLMLVFIKLKIGADLGFVLAKGVGFSLICNFTVMPAMIIWADRYLNGKNRKIPALPAARLARFEKRFRYPLAVLALVVFICSAIFQRRTTISFVPTWSSVATDAQRSDNPLMLIYDTADEAVVPALLDSIATSRGVSASFSWPSGPAKACSVEQMQDLLTGEMLCSVLDGSMAGMPDASAAGFAAFDESALANLDSLAQTGMLTDVLRLLYYAQRHPWGEGRLSFDELMEAAGPLSDAGLVPARFDMNKMMERMFAAAISSDKTADIPSPEPSLQDQPEPGLVAAVVDSLPATLALPAVDTVVMADSLAVDTLAIDSVPVDSVAVASAPADTSVAVPAKVKLDEKTLRRIMASGEIPAEYAEMMAKERKLSYEEVVTPLTPGQMEDFLGIETDMMPMLYRMAGRAGKTMSPYELSLFAKEKLSKGMYARMVPAVVRDLFLVRQAEIEEVYKAGPAPLVAEVPADTSHVVLVATIDNPIDSVLVAASSIDSIPVATPEIATAVIEPPTPVEILAEMAFSGRRYSARRIQRALTAAGIPVSLDEMQLMHMYALSRRDFDPSWTSTPEELLAFAVDSLLQKPAVSQYASDFADQAAGARDALASARKLMRGDKISAAVVITDYPYEGDETFAFIDRVRSLADESLPHTHYWIGESEMYKELKDSFPKELLLLTVLTVLSIFLIVAIDFRSLFVPIPLIMVIMSGVYINVIVSGIGGRLMFYMAYLIVQGILMGATIDYSILFTSVYRSARSKGDIVYALEAAYRGASHSILSSGIILSLVPIVMYLVMEDPMIGSVVKSLGIGAFSAMILILFVLPGLIAAFDPLIYRRPRS